MEAAETADSRGRRRWIVAVSVAIVAVLGTAAVAFALGRDGSGRTRSVKLAAAVDGVQEIPGFPARDSPATTSVHGSLFVFGGSRPGSPQFRNDGVLVTPDFASATHLPDAPFDAPLSTPKAVGVDGQVVVVGIACKVLDTRDNDSDTPPCVPGTNAAAVLDLRDGRMAWRAVELPDALATIHQGGANALGATSDGRAIFEFFPYHHETFWSFDPRTDEWREIEGPGVRPDRACMSGDTVIVQSASYRNNGKILDDDPMRNLVPGGSSGGYLGDGYVLPTIASRDLTSTGSWMHSSPADGVVYISGSVEMACAGDGAFVRDGAYQAVSRVYSLRDRSWSEPPPPPVKTFTQAPVWTGSELVFMPTDADTGRAGTAYNPSTDAWRTLTGFPEMTRGAFWNGTVIVGYSEPHGISRANDISSGGPPTATAGVFRYVVPAG